MSNKKRGKVEKLLKVTSFLFIFIFLSLGVFAVSYDYRGDSGDTCDVLADSPYTETNMKINIGKKSEDLYKSYTYIHIHDYDEKTEEYTSEDVQEAANNLLVNSEKGDYVKIHEVKTKGWIVDLIFDKQSLINNPTKACLARRTLRRGTNRNAWYSTEDVEPYPLPLPIGCEKYKLVFGATTLEKENNGATFFELCDSDDFCGTNFRYVIGHEVNSEEESTYVPNEIKVITHQKTKTGVDETAFTWELYCQPANADEKETYCKYKFDEAAWNENAPETNKCCGDDGKRDEGYLFIESGSSSKEWVCTKDDQGNWKWVEAEDNTGIFTYTHLEFIEATKFEVKDHEGYLDLISNDMPDPSEDGYWEDIASPEADSFGNPYYSYVGSNIGWVGCSLKDTYTLRAFSSSTYPLSEYPNLHMKPNPHVRNPYDRVRMNSELSPSQPEEPREIENNGIKTANIPMMEATYALPGKGDPDKTCTEQEGVLCSRGKTTCDGHILKYDPLDDTEFRTSFCCNGECVPASKEINNLLPEFICVNRNNIGFWAGCGSNILEKPSHNFYPGGMPTTFKDFGTTIYGDGDKEVKPGTLYLYNQVLVLGVSTLGANIKYGWSYEIDKEAYGDAEFIYDWTEYDKLIFFFKGLKKPGAYTLYFKSMNDKGRCLDVTSYSPDIKELIEEDPIKPDKWYTLEVDLSNIRDENTLANMCGLGIRTTDTKLSGLSSDIPFPLIHEYDGKFYDLVFLDRITLVSNEQPGYYCTFVDTSDPKDGEVDVVNWLNTLDYSQACNEQPGYYWTGDDCCGDGKLNEVVAEETYNDDANSYACWEGEAVFPDTLQPYTSGSTSINLLNYGGQFYGCGVLPETENALLTKIKDATNSNSGIIDVKNNPPLGNEGSNQCYHFPNSKYYCDVSAGEWKSATTYEGTYIDTLKEKQDEPNNKGCCPESYCWSGTDCVGPGEFDDSNDYRCMGGIWRETGAKRSPDGKIPGYCPDDTECFVSKDENEDGTENVNCVTSGTFVEYKSENDWTKFKGDYYCEGIEEESIIFGQWTSRTKQIATFMIQPLTQSDDFIIYCDEKTKALNIHPEIQKNPFCVLTYSDGAVDKIVIGTSLDKSNEDVDFLFDDDRKGTLSNFIRNLKIVDLEGESCDSTVNSLEDDDSSFNQCGSTELYYSKGLHSIVYSGSVSKGFWGTIVGFFKSLLSWFSEDKEGAKLPSMIAQYPTLKKIYINKQGSKEIYGVFETRGSNDYIAVQYNGFTTPICDIIDNHPEQIKYGLECVPDPSNTDGNPGKYSVIASEDNLEEIWQDLTSKLRINPNAPKSTTKTTTSTTTKTTSEILYDSNSIYDSISGDLALLIHFDDGEGSTTFNDFSANNRDGVCSPPNCPTFVDNGMLGGAYSFDGEISHLAADFIEIDTGDFELGDEYTISVWVNPRQLESLDAIMTVEEMQSTTPWSCTGCCNYQMCFYNDNSLTLINNGPERRISGGDIEINKWQHLIVNRNGQMLTLYLNGEIIAQEYFAKCEPYGDDDILLGGWDDDSYDGRFFNGIMDELAIWNRALTEGEVQKLYNGQVCLSHGGTWNGESCS